MQTQPQVELTGHDYGLLFHGSDGHVVPKDSLLREEAEKLSFENLSGLLDTFRKEDLLLIVETYLKGVKLRDWVRRVCSTADEKAEEAMYETLKKRRNRTLRKLRKYLEEHPCVDNAFIVALYRWELETRAKTLFSEDRH